MVFVAEVVDKVIKYGSKDFFVFIYVYILIFFIDNCTFDEFAKKIYLGTIYVYAIERAQFSWTISGH